MSPPGCGQSSSFSIRRILNLPEESEEDCAPSLSNSSSAQSCPPALPLVPRVVRPIVHNYGDTVPGFGVMNWQDLGLTRYFHHWSYRSCPFRDQGLPLGK